MKGQKTGNKSLFQLFNLFILIVCSIVGVGFISGAEIYEFYVKFERYFYIGIITFFILIFVLVRKIINSYYFSKNNVKMLKNNNFNKNNTILIKNKIKRFLIFFDVLMIASAMISGLNHMTKQLFKYNYLVVMIICVLIIYFVLCVGIKGITKVDILLLILIAFISVVFVLDITGVIKISIENHDIEILYNNDKNSYKNIIFSIIFASLYVFMNIIQVEPILKEYEVNFTKKSVNSFSFVLSIALTLVLLLFSLFLKKNIFLYNQSMPFLFYFNNLNPVLSVIYVFGLFLALISSLLSCLLGVKRELSNLIKTNYIVSAVSVILVLLIGMINFTTFISVIYPIIGIINFVIFVFL